ncbi:MAG: hypothetical protein K2M49_02735 [Muribaculaceae bacterium]|nr:hypothetical protein [Muribaculaceae bacterium]
MDNKEIAISVVSKVTGVAKSTILSRTREWPAVEARQLIILLLSRDGATDEAISWMLNRGRGAILKSRHNANDALRLSKLFKTKFDKASEMYEHQKSLRVSEI